MLTTKRKPASVGEILTDEFMGPMGLRATAESGCVRRRRAERWIPLDAFERA
jgi:plasmid maintenance system antidote protein VapI